MEVSHPMGTARTGKKPGEQIGPRYRGNVAQYDPSTGRTHRAAITLAPEEAVRAIAMAERAGLSVSGFFNALLKTAQIDSTTGLPVGIEPAEDENALPFAQQEAS